MIIELNGDNPDRHILHSAKRIDSFEIDARIRFWIDKIATTSREIKKKQNTLKFYHECRYYKTVMDSSDQCLQMLSSMYLSKLRITYRNFQYQSRDLVPNEKRKHWQVFSDALRLKEDLRKYGALRFLLNGDKFSFKKREQIELLFKQSKN